jgi:hypothetical protein
LIQARRATWVDDQIQGWEKPEESTMETGATRNIGAIAHDPPLRRDDVARSHVATELPTTKTVRAAQEASAGNVAGERRGDHPAVKTEIGRAHV